MFFRSFLLHVPSFAAIKTECTFFCCHQKKVPKKKSPSGKPEPFSVTQSASARPIKAQVHTRGLWENASLIDYLQKKIKSIGFSSDNNNQLILLLLRPRVHQESHTTKIILNHFFFSFFCYYRNFNQDLPCILNC